jgi:glutamate N-acetyltransferase/amino-acid N-acetyltransferase
VTVTFAKGFKASGICAGLKESARLDLALVVNSGPEYACAATYTPNRFRAAPVNYSESALKTSGGVGRAVVVNSGNANACTGAIGLEHATEMAQAVAAKLEVPETEVQVCSTGKIGIPLEIEKVIGGIEIASNSLSDTPQAGIDAAEAICTSDTVRKVGQVQSDGYRIGGMVKVAGMIAPEMATMICVITTDAVVDSEILQQVTNQAVNLSFNRLDSDGCMSTNDTVIVMANGASGIQPEPSEFLNGLTAVMSNLAKQIIDDAEGASHSILIRIVNASSETSGLAVARAISRSNLLKAALSGNDPNWGRILAAAGTVPESEAPYVAEEVDVLLNGVLVSKGGAVGNAVTDPNLLVPREIVIEVNLKAGAEVVELWTNDLTKQYVEFNADYTS